MEVKSTEWEFSSWVKGEINRLLEKGGYPFKEATVEPSLKGKRPDIVIWFSRARKEAFAFIAVKRPEIPADGHEVLEDLPEKAGRLNVRYAITWNVREAVLWQIEEGKRRLTADDRLKSYSPLPIPSLEDWLIESVKVALRGHIEEFLNDLRMLQIEGHLHPFIPDKLFFTQAFREAVEKLSPSFKDFVKDKTKDKSFRERLHAWAVKQGIANPGTEEFYTVLARQLVYRLVGRILFYLTLRRHFRSLPSLELSDMPPNKVGSALRDAFAEARKVDWQAVFEEDLLDEMGFPSDAKDALCELLVKLDRYNFGLLKEDVIGEIFEELIPYEERHALGQYFTREDLVDFILAFTVHDPDGSYLDPTCGSGTFLNRCYSRLRWLSAYRKDHHQLLSQLWGIDIAHFPAELATINLFRQDLSDYSNFPRIHVRDFFEVNPGDEFEFPPPKPGPKPDFRIKERIPTFSAAFGNFPYIRQELIERQVKGYKRFLTEVLARDWLLEFPAIFKTRAKEGELNLLREKSPEESSKALSDLVRQGKVSLLLSGQADIYTYLFFHVARFLEGGGRLGFVTSNAWLDVAYGAELKRFFLEKFKVIAIVESRVELWFEDPSVNTVFTILERCDDAEERAQHTVKFVKLKKRLADLIPYRDLKIEEAKRWKHLNGLVAKIESLGAAYLRFDRTAVVSELEGVKSWEDDDFRVRMVKQADLLNELEEKGALAKWGKYLRAPDVYFEILEKAGDRLVPFKEVAEIRRGYTAGITEFFYLNEDEIEHWGIEEEFLRPVITSLKELETLVIRVENARKRLFVCPLSKEELRRMGKNKAVRYIEWGEQQKTKGRGRVGKAGIPFPEVPSVRSRRYWHALELKEPSHIIINRFVGERFFFPVNEDRLLISDTFFESVFHKDPELMSALVNSTLTYLVAELTGRITWTQGVLYVYGPEIREMLLPDPALISEEHRRRILRAFEKLKARPIGSVFEEVKRRDRRELDTAVLEALGLEPKEYLPRIYKGLTELVRERLELPKMRKRQKKAAVRRDLGKLKRQIAQELLPGGLKPFPEGFVATHYLKEAKEVPVPGKPLKLGTFFLNQWEVVTEDGEEVYTAGSLDEAKFIIYAQKPNQFLVRVPSDPIVVEKAVTDYERYIKGVREKLVTRFFEATFDHKLADRLAREVLTDFGFKAQGLGYGGI